MSGDALGGTAASGGALVICTGGGIGDVLLATPVMRALRARYGSVVALTSRAHEAVLVGNPDVAEIWTDEAPFPEQAARIARAEFAASVTTWASLRAAALPYVARVPARVGQDRRLYSRLFTHRVIVRSERGDRTTHWTQILLDFARALDCEPRDAAPSFTIPNDARASVAAKLAGAHRGAANVARPYVVLHPTRGISAARERWPAAPFVALARALAADLGARVIVTGGPDDRAFSDAIARESGAVSFGGRTTLAEFGALAADARAVVAMDSGPMHVAAAVGAPTLGIFALASDEPDRWAPIGPHTAVVRATYPCPPAHRKETCPNFACVAALDSVAIVAATRELIAGAGDGRA